MSAAEGALAHSGHVDEVGVMAVTLGSESAPTDYDESVDLRAYDTVLGGHSHGAEDHGRLAEFGSKSKRMCSSPISRRQQRQVSVRCRSADASQTEAPIFLLLNRPKF